MKLLFDQNISFRLVKKMQDLFPGSVQVREIGLENATDIKIFNYAKKEDLTIVTFDSDFLDLNTLYGFPPRIIWLRIGNNTTSSIENVLRNKYDLIIDFSKENYGCLEINKMSL